MKMLAKNLKSEQMQGMEAQVIADASIVAYHSSIMYNQVKGMQGPCRHKNDKTS